MGIGSISSKKVEQKKVPEQKQIVVRNLDAKIDERELQANLMFYGEILNIQIIRNTPASAFVDFDSGQAAKLASDEMDGIFLNGRTIQVELARPGELQKEKDKVFEAKKRSYEESCQAQRESEEAIQRSKRQKVSVNY